MDSNPFFRFLGRVNTVLITLAGLAILCGAVVSELWWMPYAPRGAQHAVAPVDQAGYSYHLDDIQLSQMGSDAAVPDGWNQAVMALDRQRGDGDSNPYSGSFSGSRGSDVRSVNLLLVDIATGATRWLFPGTARDIVSMSAVHGAKTEAYANGPVSAMLMTVADADTNHDGRIDGGDDVTLYVYKPGAAAATKILAAHDVWSVHQIDPARLMVLYNDAKGAHMAVFSTADYRVLTSSVLPQMPH